MINGQGILQPGSQNQIKGSNPQGNRRSESLSYADSRGSMSQGLLESTMSLQAHSGEVGMLLVIEIDNENILVTCGSSMSEKKIKFWDMVSMNCSFELDKKGFGAVTAMAFCKQSLIFVTSTSDRSLFVYKFNVNLRRMVLLFSQRLTFTVSRLECHKNMVLIGSSQKNQIIWMNVQSRRIVKVYPIKCEFLTFSYIPKIQCIATGLNGCSLMRLRDSKVIDIYYILEEIHQKNPSRRNHQTVSQEHPNLIKLASPILIRNGIGTDGHTQSCQIAMYQKSLKCVIFVFFDFILFYNVISKRIIYILKDLLPIENVEYSAVYDLLLIHCSESSSSDSSFFLLFTRDGFIKNDDNLTLQFSKLSCNRFPRARLSILLNYYIISDQCINKGTIIRRRLTVSQKFQLSPSIQINSYSSRTISKFAPRENRTGARNSAHSENRQANTEPSENIQLNSMLETVQEEEPKIVQNVPSPNKEKMCRCLIF